MTFALAVIVPTLDEVEHLGRLLGQLDAQRDVDLEVVVADGGSTDSTVDVAREGGATIVSAARGRGAQMNAGRAAADSPWLLFLHADVRITDPDLLGRSLRELQRTIAERGDDRVAGHFCLGFYDTPAHHRIRYRFLETKTALNRPLTINGDQGLLIAARYFEELGGFDESMPFLEDQRIAREIRESGEWITLPGRIETSARRFESEGFARRYFVMATIMAAWMSGAEEFFELAPNLYVEQRQTRRLDLRPVFGAIIETNRRLGVRRSAAVWGRVFRALTANAWQLALAADVLLDSTAANEELLCLELYDRLVEACR